MKAFIGQVGWSNKRSGVEIYRSWEDGRWADGTNGWGRLLAWDIETVEPAEGKRCLVLVSDKRGDSSALEDVLRKLGIEVEAVDQEKANKYGSEAGK